MKHAQVALALALLASPLSLPGEGLAKDEAPGPGQPQLVNRTEISERALSGATGMIGVNMAAGDTNVQTNIRAIVVGGEAASDARSEQKASGSAPALPSRQENIISGGAFSGAVGIIGVNQSAGYGNTQGNLLAIGLGGEALPASSTDLQSTRSNAAEPAPAVQGTRSDIIGAQAFSGARGVIQVNQSAGNANQVTNAMGINVRSMSVH